MCNEKFAYSKADERKVLCLYTCKEPWDPTPSRSQAFRPCN